MDGDIWWGWLARLKNVSAGNKAVIITRFSSESV